MILSYTQDISLIQQDKTRQIGTVTHKMSGVTFVKIVLTLSTPLNPQVLLDIKSNQSGKYICVYDSVGKGVNFPSAERVQLG